MHGLHGIIGRQQSDDGSLIVAGRAGVQARIRIIKIIGRIRPALVGQHGLPWILRPTGLLYRLAIVMSIKKHGTPDRMWNFSEYCRGRISGA